MPYIPKHPIYGALHCIAEQTTFKGNRFDAVEKILSWLIKEDIIKPEKCIVRYQQNGHRFSEGLKKVITGGFPDITSDYVGLEYNTERETCFSNPSLDYILCPNCKNDLESNEEHEDIFWKALNQWKIYDGDEFVHCPVCDKKVLFHAFQFGTVCGFSDLAFTFFDCRGFTEVFQAEFERQLGCPVRLVVKHYV